MKILPHTNMISYAWHHDDLTMTTWLDTHDDMILYAWQHYSRRLTAWYFVDDNMRSYTGPEYYFMRMKHDIMSRRYRTSTVWTPPPPQPPAPPLPLLSLPKFASSLAPSSYFSIWRILTCTYLPTYLPTCIGKGERQFSDLYCFNCLESMLA